VVEHRAALLVDYQNAGYARQYRDFVERVRQAEASLGAGTRLTETVARGLYKLMAYKDEYEVARLYADPAFMAKIGAMFEGDVKLTFHLAPPLLARTGSEGHPVKQAYGPWMLRAFRVLAHLKGLRGTPFDPFGHTAERRMERALVADYRRTIDGLLPRLNAANLAQAVAIAAIPDDIRGFGHVKAARLGAARIKEAKLLSAFESAA
jgi:indolepyruvate ferredoxin oxidoreductase